MYHEYTYILKNKFISLLLPYNTGIVAYHRNKRPSTYVKHIYLFTDLA